MKILQSKLYSQKKNHWPNVFHRKKFLMYLILVKYIRLIFHSRREMTTTFSKMSTYNPHSVYSRGSFHSHLSSQESPPCLKGGKQQ